MPVPIPKTSASWNGCGSYDFRVNFSSYDNLDGFNACCNSHDICYNNCAQTKADCDKKLHECLLTDVKNSNNVHKLGKS